MTMTTTDRTMKALLFAIALGLWVNVATQWLTPAAVHAQVGKEIFGDPQFAEIARQVKMISLDTAAMRISLSNIAVESALRRR